METILVTQIVDVPIERVWNALTQEAELRKWYFTVENYIFEVGKEFNILLNKQGCPLWTALLKLIKSRLKSPQIYFFTVTNGTASSISARITDKI